MADPTTLGRISADLDMAEHARVLLMQMEVSDRAHARAGQPIPAETQEEIEGRRARLQAMRDRLGGSAAEHGVGRGRVVEERK
jgi:hypothetical protein